MKKSELKNIIRESINDLMNEQAGGCTPSTPGYSNLTTINVPSFSPSQPAVNYTPSMAAYTPLTWYVCGAQYGPGSTPSPPQSPNGCCNANNDYAYAYTNNPVSQQAVDNAQSMPPGSNSGVYGIYARFEDCARNCPGAFSPSNPPPQYAPCGDYCWQGYHNLGLTTTPQSPGPTGVGTDNTTPRIPTQGSNNPCAEFSRFTRAEKSDICEECLTRPQGQFCECCEDTMIR